MNDLKEKIKKSIITSILDVIIILILSVAVAILVFLYKDTLKENKKLRSELIGTQDEANYYQNIYSELLNNMDKNDYSIDSKNN